MFFIFYSLFDKSPSKRIAFAILIFYLFGGGSLVVPVYIVPCILFCTLFRIVPSASAGSGGYPQGGVSLAGRA